MCVRVRGSGALGPGRPGVFVAPEQLRVLTRDPSKPSLASHRALGAELVAADLGEPEEIALIGRRAYAVWPFHAICGVFARAASFHERSCFSPTRRARSFVRSRKFSMQAPRRAQPAPAAGPRGPTASQGRKLQHVYRIRNGCTTVVPSGYTTHNIVWASSRLRPIHDRPRCP